MRIRKLAGVCAAVALATCAGMAAALVSPVDQHQLGDKYSPLKQINKGNVAQLAMAWEYHTGEVPAEGTESLIAFEDQPSLIEGNLVVCTTSRRLIALDPQTGKERWVYDPEDRKVGMRKCRGIASWVDRQAQEGASCKTRIFLATADNRVVAIDARNGRPCSGFGRQGEVQMTISKPEAFPGEVVATSRPAVVNDVIVIGSAVADNQRVDAPSGRVLAFDARTGAQVWQWAPLPRDPQALGSADQPPLARELPLLGFSRAARHHFDADLREGAMAEEALLRRLGLVGPGLDQQEGVCPWEALDVTPAAGSWEKGTAEGYGGGNVWAAMAVDQALDLVYLPTTSPSGDFYGGGRAGDNLYSSSVVALRGATGEVAWYYQFVHHNVFDYDTPAQPLLIDLPYKGKSVPALVQNTKMGLVFVFNRETGEPLISIEERKVPQSGTVAGEKLSPTQPFPVDMPAVMPLGFSPDDAWGFTFIDEWLCRNKVEELRYGPIYTPASEQGTVFSPSAGGGPNWGGGAYDPESHIMVVPSNRVPMVITLFPADAPAADDERGTESLMSMTFPVGGSPYHYRVEPLMSPLRAPCSKPPWAALTAVDLVDKKIVWEVPLGDVGAMMSLPFSLALGTPGAGGPLVTAGGLVFIGYTLDDRFRAFDLHSGEVLWEAELPAAGTAIPVTYEAGGEQYVVIPAGGHTMYQSSLGDSVVAYKLKR